MFSDIVRLHEFRQQLWEGVNGQDTFGTAKMTTFHGMGEVNHALNAGPAGGGYTYGQRGDCGLWGNTCDLGYY